MPRCAVIGQPLDRADEPSLQFGLGTLDNPHAHHALGGPLGQGQRNEGSAKAKNSGKNQQATGSALHQMHAEHVFDDEQHDAEQREDREVGEDEEENAFHGALNRKKLPQYGNATH